MAPMAATSDWTKFFMEAGLPANLAANYAITFTDHRIQRSMLADLSKEILNDMGIKALGDIIAILKHAKDVYTHEEREKMLAGNGSNNSLRRSTPASRTVAHYLPKGDDMGPMGSPMLSSESTTSGLSRALAARLGDSVDTSESSKESVAMFSMPPEIKNNVAGAGVASTMQKVAVNETIENSSETATPNTTPKKIVKVSTKLKKKQNVVDLRQAKASASPQKEEVPTQKKRRVLAIHEGTYTVKMPVGNTAKTKKILASQKTKATAVGSSVFDRLGDSDEVSSSGISSSLQKTKNSDLASSVFSRLGPLNVVSISAATSTSGDMEDDDEGKNYTEYGGVLKTLSKKQPNARDDSKQISAFDPQHQINKRTITFATGTTSEETKTDDDSKNIKDISVHYVHVKHKQKKHVVKDRAITFATTATPLNLKSDEDKDVSIELSAVKSKQKPVIEKKKTDITVTMPPTKSITQVKKRTVISTKRLADTTVVDTEGILSGGTKRKTPVHERIGSSASGSTTTNMAAVGTSSSSTIISLNGKSGSHINKSSPTKRSAVDDSLYAHPKRIKFVNKSKSIGTSSQRSTSKVSHAIFHRLG